MKMNHKKNWHKVIVGKTIFQRMGVYTTIEGTSVLFCNKVKLFDHLDNKCKEILLSDEVYSDLEVLRLNDGYAMLLSKDGRVYTHFRGMPLSVMIKEYPELMI